MSARSENIGLSGFRHLPGMFAAEIVLEADRVSANLKSTGCRSNVGSRTPETVGGLQALFVRIRTCLGLPAGPLRISTCLRSLVLGVHG